jgi:hypothetical protein
LGTVKSSANFLPQAVSSEEFRLPDAPPRQAPPRNRGGSDTASKAATPNKDVIHVTLEAASMKQLIKLSQDIMNQEQLDRDVSMPEFAAQVAEAEDTATRIHDDAYSESSI